MLLWTALDPSMMETQMGNPRHQLTRVLCLPSGIFATDDGPRDCVAFDGTNWQSLFVLLPLFTTRRLPLHCNPPQQSRLILLGNRQTSERRQKHED